MSVPATLTTERLVLRAFTPDDAPDVQRYCSDRDIAAMTATIPHPYPEGAALAWIERQRETSARGESAIFAVTLPRVGLVGAVGLELVPAHAKAELGYWIGKPFWRRGFATEAARAVVRHGFEAHRLERVFARFMRRNVASGRVLARLGFTREGVLRRELYRFGAFVDCELWALLREEFLRSRMDAAL